LIDRFGNDHYNREKYLERKNMQKILFSAFFSCVILVAAEPRKVGKEPFA
jgi:hypothetical protein